MAAPAHVRVTMIAEQQGGDIAQCTLALRGVIDAFPDGEPIDWLNHGTVFNEEGHLSLIADACEDFWARPTSHISGTCKLVRVKMAALDDDGHYQGAPVEFAKNTPGGVELGTWPQQLARKVTLLTDGDFGRVKGGFYLPGVTNQGYDDLTGLFSAGVALDVRDSVKTLLDDLEETATGATAHAQVVIASGGRHNSDGSVRRPPTLHDIVGVNVGRRIDIQRRRANAIGESRTATVSVG